MSENDEEVPLWHQSGVNLAGEPFIQVLSGDKIIGQMSASQAREWALQILEAAEASEQDAFLMDLMRNKFDLEDHVIAGLIAEFREYRAQRSGKKGGPSRPTDWVMPPKDEEPRTT